jgi:Family of unknown function (DUF6111)
MIRPIFTEAVLFLAPFAAYALYLWITKAGIFVRTSWEPATLAWLVIVALAISIVSFLFLAEFSGAPPGSTYTPARIEGGRVVPGSEQ